jgi:hypothetical protein
MSSVSFILGNNEARIILEDDPLGGIRVTVTLINSNADLTGIFWDCKDNNPIPLNVATGGNIFSYTEGKDSVLSVSSSTGNVSMSGGGTQAFDAAVGIQKPGSGFVPSVTFTITGSTATLSNFEGIRWGLRINSGGPSNKLIGNAPQFARLGDRVFLDSNGNGIQDFGEVGLSGITVQLLDSNALPVRDSAGQSITTTTDNSGAYSFTVNPGIYRVRFLSPNSAYLFSRQDQGANDTIDSDVDSAGVSTAFTLTSGQTNNTLDAGLYQNITIGDSVFLDSNANGIQDAGEAGLAGVTVQLLNSSNAVVATTTTNTNGLYSFSSTPGTYKVKILAPSNSNPYLFSPQDQGANDTIDSDVDAAGVSTAFILTSGQANSTLDAGLYQNVTIGDSVFLDSNANGIQDAGEAGLAGVTVQLLNSSNAVVATTTTNTNGLYSFSSTPGTYKVKILAPSNSNPYLFSPQDQGANDTIDSDVDAAGVSTAFILTSGQANSTLDAGLYQNVTIGDSVFLDSNANGIQDAGEAGLAGVTVQLLNSSNAVVATTTTNTNGLYSFSSTPGTYKVKVLVEGTNYQFTSQDQGTDDFIDSDVDSNGISAPVTVSTGQTNNTIDAGLQNVDLAVSTEFVLEKFLLDRDGVDSDGDGNLELEDTYLAEPVASQPPNPNNTNILQTVTQYINVKNNGLTSAKSVLIKVDNIQSSLLTFAGASVPYTITNNGNTIELVVPNITGNGGTNQIALNWNVVQSNALQLKPLDIQYLFGSDSPTNLPSSDYSNVVAKGKLYIDRSSAVKENGTTVVEFKPFDPFVSKVTAIASNDVNQSNNAAQESVFFSRSSLEARLRNNAISKFRSIYNQIVDVDPTLYSDPAEPGITTPGIGNKVWEDKNENGVQDSGEYGVAGVVVNLFTSTGSLIRQVKTQTGGYYSFGSLAANSYYITVQKPNNYKSFSPANLADNTSTDSDVSSTGRSNTFSVTSTTNTKNFDVGLVGLTDSVSGTQPVGATYAVINRSDAIDSGEVGIARINPYWI